ncbi:MAG: nicotinate-nucleotide--dimethylbenzimidazole phosphoribosyltransferase [Actinomycetota bacterium]|nr:nicotinate-nucleotide--dimethylbenzimidazole phosphoribosyltransferase [Actinomycetota bacterium]
MASDALPAEVSASIARIASPTQSAVELPPGELARLDAWWRAVGDGQAPRVAWVTAPPDARDSPNALSAGLAAADAAIDAGASLIVPTVPAPNAVAARTVIAVLSRAGASTVTYQSPGMTDAAWMAVCAQIRDRSADVSSLRATPLALLDALGAVAIAYTAGVLLGSAARRTPCLVDGTDALAAALIADRLSFRAREWWRAAATSPDPGRQVAADRIDLSPGLPLGLVVEDGSGARATVALLGMIAEDAS